MLLAESSTRSFSAAPAPKWDCMDSVVERKLKKPINEHESGILALSSNSKIENMCRVVQEGALKKSIAGCVR